MNATQQKAYQYWLAILNRLARDRGHGWLIPPNPDFADAFLDGLSPAEALDEETDAARQSL